MKITNIKQQVKRTDRFAVFVDGKYEFSLGESELLDSKLNIGDEISQTELKKLKQRAGEGKIMDRCLHYIAIRPRSRWEIQSYLQRKKIASPTIIKMLNKLSNNGFIDDEAFAQAWVNNRRLLKPISKRKLILELRQKRVDNSVIDKAMSEDEVEDISSLHQMIEKKRSRYPDEVKLMQYLIRQGYNYGDIKTALQEFKD